MKTLQTYSESCTFSCIILKGMELLISCPVSHCFPLLLVVVTLLVVTAEQTSRALQIGSVPTPCLSWIAAVGCFSKGRGSWCFTHSDCNKDITFNAHSGSAAVGGIYSYSVYPNRRRPLSQRHQWLCVTVCSRTSQPDCAAIRLIIWSVGVCTQRLCASNPIF